MRHDLIPILSLLGVILDALGGLYLAYDLLGGKRGPLRTITKSISYGAMFAIGYAVPLGVWFGLAGLLVSGPALSLEIERRQARAAHPFAAAVVFGVMRAISFGVAGWLSKDAEFGIYFGIFSAVGLVVAYLIVGPPGDLISERRRLIAIRRGIARGASIGVAAILSGALHREAHALTYGIEVGLVTGMTSGVLVSVAPAIELWADNLPAYRLGAYGAMLVLIGSVFQTFQYVFPMMGLSVK